MKYQHRNESNLAYFWRKHGVNEWLVGVVIGAATIGWLGYLTGIALDK